MLKSLFSRLTGRNSDPSGMPPRSQVTENVSPGAPFHLGDESVPVPRWPERGAAMIAATPESLLATQTETIDKIRASSPLLPSEFTQLVVPVLQRYAAWVHLLPASESHHHYGPGGLLSHGLEVAMHAARMSDGKAVGIELPPSDRARYAPRWKVASMLAGLLHDLGKPLVDVGATDIDRTMTWPAQAGPIYGWLQEHGLTHYQFYWRPGSRHERHKPVGTAVSREVIGPELLRWLSDEPTQSVVDLMMLSIAQGKTRGNLMSVIVSDADSMSVEADLRKLAEKSRATGQGALNSAASLVIAEIRSAVDDGTLPINKNGRPLWWTSEGLVGLYPAVLDEVIPRLASKKIAGIPSSRPELAKLLCETGFVEPATGTDEDGEEHQSHTWEMTMTVGHGDIQIKPPALRVLKFAKPEFVLGALPLPPPHDAQVKSPLLGNKEKDALAMGIQVLGETSAAASTTEAGAAAGAPPASASAPPPSDASAPPAAAPHGAAPEDDGPAIESRRNRRDLASDRSVEQQRRRESREDARALNDQYQGLIEKVRRTGVEGEVVATVLERIQSGALLFGEDFCDTVDGLAVRFPSGLERTGVPPVDILSPLAARNWLVVETGSDRKVCDVDYPTGQRHKSIVFTNLVGRAWSALKAEQEEVLTARPELRRNPQSAAQAPEPAAPKPPQSPPPASNRAPPPRPEAPPRQRPAPARQENPVQAQGGKPQTTPPAPVPTAAAAPANDGGRPRNKADIMATKASDLTPKRVRFINEAACSMLHREQLWGTCSPEQLHAALVDFAKRNDIRLGLLPTALYDAEHGLLQPPAPDKPFVELGAAAIRPGYQVPAWIADLMAKQS